MRNSGLLWSSGGLLLPSSLSLTGSFRDWTGTSPWSGEASLGTSGSNTASDLNSSIGTFSLNGHNAALYDTSSSDVHVASGTLDTYFNSTSASGWFLLYADVDQTLRFSTDDNTTAYFFNLSIERPSGYSYPNGVARFWLNNDIPNSRVEAPFTYQQWQLVTFRFDGTTMQVGVDNPPGSAGGASQKAYGTAISTMTNFLRWGREVSPTVQFQGKIADIGLSDTVLTDAQFNGIKAYCNWRYALSL